MSTVPGPKKPPKEKIAELVFEAYRIVSSQLSVGSPYGQEAYKQVLAYLIEKEG